MKRTMLSAATAVLATTTCLADYVVEGTVVDRQGEPLIGATVKVGGTSIGTAADIDGHFRLKVPDNAREISIDYVGYEPPHTQSPCQYGRCCT